MTECEKQIIERVENMYRSTRAKLALTDDEIKVCEKYGVDPNNYSYSEQGNMGHRIANKIPIGAYIVGKGFYKIVDVKYNYTAKGSSFEVALITYYSKKYRTDFLEEEVLINARPLYNRASIGPKRKLEKGMILHIKEDTTVVNNSYRIVWEIL